MSIEVLTRNESVKYWGQRISFYQQETTDIKSADQFGMGDLPQIQTRVDINKLHAQTSSTAFRRHSLSDCLLRSGNLGTKQRTRENDPIDATKRCYDSLSRQKRKYKKIEKQDIGPKEDELRMTWTVKYSFEDDARRGN